MLLYDLYMQDQNSLIKELQNTSTSQEVIRVIHEYLEKVTDQNGEYISGLTRSQAQVALSILGIYQQHFRKLLNTFEPMTNIRSDQHAPSSQSHVKIEEVEAAIAGIIGVGTFASILNPLLLTIPIGAIMGVVAVKIKNNIQASANSSNQTANEPSISSQHIDYNPFMADLADIFKTVDKVVKKFGELEDAARPRHVEKPKLEDHTQFLEFIQDILGWYQRNKGNLPKSAQRRLDLRLEDQLPDLFSKYNIQISYYNPENNERDDVLFDYEEEVGKPRLSAPIMNRPALSKEGKVLLRGRVTKPQQSSTIKQS